MITYHDNCLHKMIGVILSFLINDFCHAETSVLSCSLAIKPMCHSNDWLSGRCQLLTNCLKSFPTLVTGCLKHPYLDTPCIFVISAASFRRTLLLSPPTMWLVHNEIQIKMLQLGEIIDLSKCQWWQEGEQFYKVLTSAMWFTVPTVSMWHKIKSVIFLSKCKTHTFAIIHLFFWFLPGCLSEMSCLCREKLRDSRSMGTEKLACRHSTGTSACMGDIRQHPATVSLHWDLLWVLLGKFFSTIKGGKKVC